MYLVVFYKKLKNVSCEYDRLNGWNSTLQAVVVFKEKKKHPRYDSFKRPGRTRHCWEAATAGVAFSEILLKFQGHPARTALPFRGETYLKLDWDFRFCTAVQY